MPKDVINPRTGQMDLSYLEYGPRYVDQGVIGDWMHPSNKEARQFDEQLLLDYAEPSARMEGLKAAGINPLTAAAAVAGQTSNAPQPASSTNPLGDIAGAAASVADAATGGFANIAKGLFDIGTREPTIDKLKNEAATEFEKIGLTKAEATIAAASAEYADENALRDIQIKRVNLQTLNQSYKNLKAQHELIMEDINLKIQQAELVGSQQDYYDAMKLKVDEDTRWLKSQNDFWEQNGYDRTHSSTDAIIAQMIANGRDPEPYIEAWCGYNKRFTKASEVAKAEESFNYRPSNPTEAAFTIANDASELVQTKILGSKTGDELYTKIKADEAASMEFEQMFVDYKHELYEIYKQKKRAYKRMKNIANMQEVASLKNAMDNSYNAYQECTPEKFSDMLVKQLGDPASTPMEE